jgi:hypothetical protein
MILGYYPGAGGNRYFQYRKNKEYSTPGIAYDFLTDHESIRFRGLFLDQENIKIEKQANILLHCVNYSRIKEVLGDDDEIVIIKSDLKSSLRREWSIKGKYKPMFYPTAHNQEKFTLDLYNAIKDTSWPEIKNLDDYAKLPKIILDEVEDNLAKNSKFVNPTGVYNFLSAAYTSIIWHNETYKKFPLEAGNATLVDIDNDDSQFAEIMRRELNSHANNFLFNFAWDVYTTHGSHAPIISLYQESCHE